MDRPDLAAPDGDPLSASTYVTGFTGRSGNLERNFAEGPGYYSLDLRVSKIFSFDRYRLEAFAEAFNLTNHVNLARPVGNLRSASFGTSTALLANAPMRQVEFGFRFDF